MLRIQGWYKRRTSQQLTWIRWGTPLLIALILVQFDWIYRHTQGVATREVAQSLFYRLGITLTFVVVLKTGLTRGWTVQDVGIVVTLVGIIGLFIRLLAQWGPQPVQEWERDYIHAFLDVGVILLFFGIFLTSIARVRRYFRQHHYSKPSFDRRKADRRNPPTPWQGPRSDE